MGTGRQMVRMGWRDWDRWMGVWLGQLALNWGLWGSSHMPEIGRGWVSGAIIWQIIDLATHTIMS